MLEVKPPRPLAPTKSRGFSFGCFLVLVFSKEADGSTAPVALLGTAQANVYVNAQGQWQAQAIPAHLRLYPFALAQGANPEQFIIVRDADAPHFHPLRLKGHPL